MTTHTIKQLNPINAADLPALGQAIDGAIFVTRYWLNGKERTLELMPDEIRGAWGKYGQDVQTSHGDGQANTEAMAEAGSDLAKKAIDAGGFIPSVLEAHLLMRGHETGIVTMREDVFYWASSQSSAYGAYYMDFELGWQLTSAKGYERFAPLVRSRIIQ